MREFLAAGNVGNIEFNQQKRIREEIQQRWDGLGLTDGLQGHVKENIATLYENEAKHILYEATDSSNSGSFETVVFPIIRRVFSKLLANDIVSVQAMNMPIGKLFFLLPVTSDREYSAGFNEMTGGTASHYGMMGANLQDRNNAGAIKSQGYVPGITMASDGSDVNPYMAKSLYDLFYNDFLYDNSKGKINIQVGTSAPVTMVNGVFTTGGTLTPAADGTIRSVILKITGFNSYNPSRLTGPDGNEMDTESFLASLKIVTKVALSGTTASGQTSFAVGAEVPFHIATQKYGKGIVERNTVADAAGAMYVEVDLTNPVANSAYDGFGGIAPGNTINGSTFAVAWAQYDTLELETEIGEVSFKLDQVTVSVEERKLRATWSPELAQDVAAFQNIDAEAELTAILSEQIAAEVDREILRDLRKAAPWQLRWDHNGWRKMAGYSTNYTQKDWNQELFTAINRISAQIHKATLRGGANFIVVSSEISAVFDNLEFFHVSDASAEQDQYNMGIERIGSLNNRYQVYRDPYAPAYSIIIGHHGKSMLDTGYIYAPYVPMQLTPTMYNPYNAAPIKLILTRYAKKVVNNRYYGHIRVDGLVTWDTSLFR
jgi:hypothetical protein